MAELWKNITMRVLHDDKKHFEYLLLEAMQCGLNWLMMLKKREVFRKCFDNFDFTLVAKYDVGKIESILKEDGMIKSRRKIEAIINNANCFLDIINEFGSFDKYIWSFSDYKTVIYKSHQEGNWEVRNEISDALAKDMKKRGFKYLGSVTIYSHLQACGMINDHELCCDKYDELLKSEHIIK